MPERKPFDDLKKHNLNMYQFCDLLDKLDGTFNRAESTYDELISDTPDPSSPVGILEYFNRQTLITIQNAIRTAKKDYGCQYIGDL